jgi:hypothetical protein
MQEWRAALAECRASSEEERRIADHQLRDYLEQSAAFEDSGLLLPISEQSRKGKKRRNGGSTLPVHASPSVPHGPARFDGPDDEDSKEEVKKRIEEDEDAINSDLDDSDDELENVDDDEGAEGPMGETILCTYDKVQRVKNKVCRNPIFHVRAVNGVLNRNSGSVHSRTVSSPPARRSTFSTRHRASSSGELRLHAYNANGQGGSELHLVVASPGTSNSIPPRFSTKTFLMVCTIIISVSMAKRVYGQIEAHSPRQESVKQGVST